MANSYYKNKKVRDEKKTSSLLALIQICRENEEFSL